MSQRDRSMPGRKYMKFSITFLNCMRILMTLRKCPDSSVSFVLYTIKYNQLEQDDQTLDFSFQEIFIAVKARNRRDKVCGNEHLKERPTRDKGRKGHMIFKILWLKESI